MTISADRLPPQWLRMPSVTNTFCRRRAATQRRLSGDRCIRQLKALADSTRLRITAALLRESVSLQTLAGKLGTSQKELSRHLHILQDAGIVAIERRAGICRYSVADGFQPGTTEIMSSILAASQSTAP